MGAAVDAVTDRTSEPSARAARTNNWVRRSKPAGEQQDDRQGEIELLLDAQRPRHQQRIQPGVLREVGGRLPEVEVTDPGHGARGAFGEPFQFGGHQQGKPCRQRDENNQDKHREDAPGASGVEAHQAETARRRAAIDDAADQEPRNDEKDVDPDVTGTEGPNLGVKQDHGRNRNGTQPVNVRAIDRRLAIPIVGTAGFCHPDWLRQLLRPR